MKKNYIIIILISIISLLINVNLFSQELKTRTVAGNLKTVWEMVWGPDNYIWFTEREGKVSRINPDTGEKTLLLTINSVLTGSERGLMGMAIHPDFDNFPYIYVVYNHGTTSDNTMIRIERYTYTGTKLENPTIIIDNIKGAINHDGARLHIDNELKLWFTIGDATIGSRAQDLTNVNGKLSRINLDGTIPDDNPFPDSPIWSFGHRNQQGLVFVSEKIYTSEHGASTNDEINLIKKGRNYGWPKVEGACNTNAEIEFCNANNVVEPILALSPNRTMAIAGIDYYNHTAIKEWTNSLLITSLKDATLVSAKLSENGEQVTGTSLHFAGEFGRLRDVCVSPTGRIFIATSNQDGRASSKFKDSMDKIIEILPVSTSIEEKDSGSNFISPNPASEYIIVKPSEGLEPSEGYKFQIFNTLGIELSSAGGDVNVVDGGGVFKIDISSLPAGVYFVKIGDKIEKFVKI
jgi:glucose/arabinose dehydrogenase